MAEMSVILSLESSEKEALERTRSDLEQTGLVVDEVMPLVKTITGRIDDQDFERLRAVDNIKDVREEQSFQLPPMDDRVPQ